MGNRETWGFVLFLVVVLGGMAAGTWYAWRQDRAPAAPPPVRPLPDLRAAPPVTVRPPPSKVQERVHLVPVPAARPKVRRCLGDDGVPIYTTEPECPAGSTLDAVREVHVRDPVRKR